MSYEKTLAYLKARRTTLSRQNDDYVARSQDKRCSPHTQREWRNLADFAREELRIVNDAIAELAPTEWIKL